MAHVVASPTPPASPRVTMRYATSRPSSTQRATVPAAPKSMSSGCAATASTRSTSGSGWTDRGNVTASPGSLREARFHAVFPRRCAPQSRRRRASLRSQGPTSGAQDQEGELGAVGAERAAEAVEDLPFAGEHQPGTAGCHPGRAHFLGDGRALLPELDDRRVDLVDPGAQ